MGEFDNSTNENVPYRVVLLECGRQMQELWLPPVIEGRFSFEDFESDRVLISIHGEGDKWVAECGKNCFFKTAQSGACKAISITNGEFVELNTENKRFILYAEVETQADNTFIPYYIEKNEHILIGRLPECDIFCASDYISRHHAELSWKNDEWYIVDLNSTNGVFVNGIAVRRTTDEAGKNVFPSNERALKVGDSIYIMGLRIILGVGYVALNNGSGRAKITSPLLRMVSSSEGIRFSGCYRPEGNEIFNRLPRHRAVVQPNEIEIEGPPPSLSEKMPMLLRLGSPIISGGAAMMTGNFMGAFTSMLMPFLTQGFTEKDRKEYDAKRNEKYGEYLEYIESKIAEEKKYEVDTLNFNYPPIMEALLFANNPSRLWERGRNDEDFLSVRIGTGDIPMMAVKHFPKERFKLEQDPLEDRMFEIGLRKEYLKKAPVMIPLTKDYVVSILGKEVERVELLRNIAFQTVMTHSYDEVKLVLLMDEDCDSALGTYAPYLPHFWNEDKSVRYIARSRDDAQQLAKQLNAVWEDYNCDAGRKAAYLKSKPAFVILAQSKKLYDSIEVFGDILTAENYSNFSIITCFENPPKECTQLIYTGELNKVTDIGNPEHEDINFMMDPYDSNTAHFMLHKVMNTHLPTGTEGFELPSMLTFLDMYNAATVEHLNPLRRWQESNPIKSLAAPIGVGTDGKLFSLDLHEKKQGPHGLVAGSTGSGKSEFIITYLLSMAVTYSPDEVSFVLIDYKGGGLADAFVDKKRGIHLPHVVGTITNLDGAGINRSLTSINSEIKRRQAVFSRAKSETGEGTMDIYDYQRLYRQKRVSEPLPHLVIVSDEFAELKKQQPEFMDELISIARIGRSLGVHLILATQKPSGVVNDQIWSNTKFRVCLKVADKGDSYEMLKRYEAAELKNTGRFYLQVGFNELFALGQSAWCGAGYEPDVNAKKEAETPDFAIQFLDNAGQVIYTAKPPKEKKKATSKQIVAIVNYLSALAARENIIPQMLWKEPLPAKLDYFAVSDNAGEPSNGHLSALIGTIDDPEHQDQYPCWLDLQSFHNLFVCAPGGAGKSTFIRTLLYSVTKRYTPEEVNYYIVDLSGGAQALFRKAAHCGAYLTENDEPGFGRLLAMLREMAAERKKAFAEAEVTSYDAYLEAGRNDGWKTMKKLPLVLMVIDSFQYILTGFAEGDKIYANFNTFMSEVSPYGIRVILTASHSNEVSTRSKQEIDARIVFNPKDRYEASELLIVRPNSVPPILPGRGMIVQDGRALEFHVASAYCDQDEQSAAQAMRADVNELSANLSSTIVKKLPVLSSGQTYEDFIKDVQPDRIPLGYYIKDMKPIILPFRQFTSLSVYFGNPNGVRPVIENFVTAAERNGMEMLVLRKNEDSCFGSQVNIIKDRKITNELFYCTENDIETLADKINNLVIERNNIVLEYCSMHGIPAEEKGKAKKAFEYVRERTKPILIMFESFADMALAQKSDKAKAVFNAFLGNALKGYNIYFIGCFYPDDYNSLRSDSLAARFNTSDMFLMFGGKFHQQTFVMSLPTEYRRREKPEDAYDMAVLRYRENWYEMQMPCGEIEQPDINPDDASII